MNPDLNMSIAIDASLLPVDPSVICPRRQFPTLRSARLSEASQLPIHGNTFAWTPDWGSTPLKTGEAAPPLALLPPSPALNGWLRDPIADEVWLDAALRGWPTTSFVRLYVLGCDGLFALHKLFGTTQFKIGLTEQKVEARIRELNRDGYASHYVGAAGWIRAEGFDDWHPKTPMVAQMPSPASPVVIMPDCIGIHLPECVSLRDFDRALVQHLETVCTDRWFRRPEVVKELAQKNVDPGIGRRGTLASGSGVHRVEEAHELFFFRPRREFGALVAIAEHIVLRALRQSTLS